MPGDRTQWGPKRSARLGLLIGLGWDPVKIAEDETICSTIRGVYEQARRLGVPFGLTRRRNVCVEISPPLSDVYEREATRRHCSRDELITRYLTTGAKEPNLIGAVLDDE